MVHTLEQLLGGHSFFSIDTGRTERGSEADISFSDVAVLYRTEAQTAAVVEALARSGMPFQQRSHTPLVEHVGVQALCRALQASEPDGTLAEQLRLAAARAKRDGAQAPEVDAALELVATVAAASGGQLPRFLANLALASGIDAWDPRADRVSLLTLHAAKGLEFAVVFILGCEDGLLPLRFGKPGADDLDEERRLFYVGMTRAKQRLYLCRTKKRRWRGKLREMAPSPFLGPIEAALLERTQASTRRTRRRDAARQLELF